MNLCHDLQVKLFCDASDIESLLTMYSKPYIKGFTTNPTLMRKAGVKDFQAFGHAVLAAIPDLPISFEVFADDEAGMERAVDLLAGRPRAELLWASSRELLNVFHAEESGTHIITATPDILSKLALLGKDLTQFSLETVRMLYTDAVQAGYTLAEVPLELAQARPKQAFAARGASAAS